MRFLIKQGTHTIGKKRYESKSDDVREKIIVTDIDMIARYGEDRFELLGKPSVPVAPVEKVAEDLTAEPKKVIDKPEPPEEIVIENKPVEEPEKGTKLVAIHRGGGRFNVVKFVDGVEGEKINESFLSKDEAKELAEKGL